MGAFPISRILLYTVKSRCVQTAVKTAVKLTSVPSGQKSGHKKNLDFSRFFHAADRNRTGTGG